MRPQPYYTQDNNPTEHLLKVRGAPGQSWLETCGPSAAVNCLAALGKDLRCTTPGDYQPQPEEVLSDFFNDPRSFDGLRGSWPGLEPAEVAGNEVAQWYPYAVKKVFGARGEFVGAMTKDQAVERLARGQKLQVCLKSPSHYVALVDHDPRRQAFVMNDPWAGRWPQGSGEGQPLSWLEFEANTKPLAVAYA